MDFWRNLPFYFIRIEFYSRILFSLPPFVIRDFTVRFSLNDKLYYRKIYSHLKHIKLITRTYAIFRVIIEVCTYLLVYSVQVKFILDYLEHSICIIRMLTAVLLFYVCVCVSIVLSGIYLTNAFRS